MTSNCWQFKGKPRKKSSNNKIKTTRGQYKWDFPLQLQSLAACLRLSGCFNKDCRFFPAGEEEMWDRNTCTLSPDTAADSWPVGGAVWKARQVSSRQDAAAAAAARSCDRVEPWTGQRPPSHQPSRTEPGMHHHTWRAHWQYPIHPPPVANRGAAAKSPTRAKAFFTIGLQWKKK